VEISLVIELLRMAAILIVFVLNFFFLYSAFFLSGLSPIAKQRESMGKGKMMVELCSVAIALRV